jgi:copper homeostasis protein
MQYSFLLEISVESVEAAMAAERGGAQRIELCSNASEGGTTPGPELLRAAREHLRLPIFSMVRPRAGDFVYSDGEFEAMQRDIEAAKEYGMNGVVLGLLKDAGQIDIPRTRQLAERAKPLPVTFHRAFDECADLRRSLEDVIQTGAERLLTSGGKRTAPEALELLGELVRIAGTRIIVMPGSGLHAGNIREVAGKTGAREFHAGLSSIVADPGNNLGAFEEESRRLATMLGECG